MRATDSHNPDMANKPMRFSDQIRRVVATSGMTQAEIGKLAGLSRSQMSRFVSGERFLTGKALDALAAVLRLQVTIGR
jgi:transcriptional regulator with XRE-family HTH domain